MSWCHTHYGVIMSVMASQITSLAIVYSTVYSGADQRKHQSSASLGFVRGIHRWLVNSPHKGPVTWKTFPFDDVIMFIYCVWCHLSFIMQGKLLQKIVRAMWHRLVKFLPWGPWLHCIHALNTLRLRQNGQHFQTTLSNAFSRMKMF